MECTTATLSVGGDSAGRAPYGRNHSVPSCSIYLLTHLYNIDKYHHILFRDIQEVNPSENILFLATRLERAVRRVRICCASYAVHAHDIPSPVIPSAPDNVKSQANAKRAMRITYSIVCGAVAHNASVSLSSMLGRVPHAA